MALQFHQLTVTAVIDETADSRSFVLDIPLPLRERFAYRAGQFLTFEIPWDEFAIRRCYSLSSSPEVDRAHRITVKRVAGGRMSNWLIDNVKAGDVLRVSPPDGRFVLNNAAESRPLTLWGGGSGITPLISLMKSTLAATKRDIKLIYANRNLGAIILKRELDALASAHSSRLHIHYHSDSDAGLLTPSDIGQHMIGREDGDHYVCGPGPFMDLVGKALLVAGIASERTFFERFVSSLDPDRRAALARAHAARTLAPSTFTLRLDGAAHAVPYEPGLTLLAAAQRCGVKAPSSCEDGYCGSCTATLVKGRVDMRSNEVLGAAELAQGKILLCQSLPASAEPMEVDCDATSFREKGSISARVPQPLMPRVLASIFVTLVFMIYFFLRSHP